MCLQHSHKNYKFSSLRKEYVEPILFDVRTFFKIGKNLHAIAAPTLSIYCLSITSQGFNLDLIKQKEDGVLFSLGV